MFLPLLNCTVSLAFTAVAVSLSLWIFQPFSRLVTLLFNEITLLVSALSKAFNCDTFTPSVSAEPAAILVIRRSLPVLPIDTSPVALPTTTIGLPIASLGCQAALPILPPVATLPVPKATELPCVELAPIPIATAFSWVAVLCPPIAMAFLPVARAPATESPPIATAPSFVAAVAVSRLEPPEPMAVALIAVAVLFIPMAVACCFVACEAVPMAVAPFSKPSERAPMATEPAPSVFEVMPKAVLK